MGLYVLFGGVYCLLLIGASLGKSDNRKLIFLIVTLLSPLIVTF